MPEHLILVNYCYEFVTEQISMSLLLYSHLPAALFALLFSAFVLFKARNKPAVALFATCLMFSLWAFFDLGAWFVFLGSNNVMLSWSLLDFFAVSMFFFGYYFLYTFATKRDLPFWQKLTGFLLLLPVAIISMSGLNLSLYDLNSCAAWEDTTFTRFTYLIEAIFLTVIVVFSVVQYRNTTSHEGRNRLLLAASGVFIFLFFLFSATFSVSLLAATDASTYVYNYLIYGMGGMPIFLVFLGLLVVRHKAFRLKMFGAQALILGLIAIIGSQFFFAASATIGILVAITLVLVCIGGYFTIRSVKKEIEQREEIEKLAEQLKAANKRLKVLDRMKSEFVSIASHQLRSPLTSIRGYSSMLLEGSYGQIPKKAVEVLQHIADSSRYMALSVEDYLNVSRIESGNMKYEKCDFNLKELAEDMADELRPEAIRRGLLLAFKSSLDSKGIVHADIGKTKQIVQNLIDNAMKYTPKKGHIRVRVHDDKKNKRIFVDIIDDGIGMSEETLHTVFDKFERAHNANDINVTGTGLGLFIARKMAEDMGGLVYATSKGEGKGSTFTLEMPLHL